ncbi:MAG: hypothetical protein KDB03_01075 [Planctomycetales bacterium]|nr:hypothetical protein [Planctomycetales bacterium]
MLISLALSIQVLAVFAQPFRFFTRSTGGSAAVTQPLRDTLAPYVEFGYLDHGYFFFAPDPGPSHLMRFEMDLSDGSHGSLEFPDRHAQWPRLLYHRHFMLAEFLQQLHVPPVDRSLAQEDPGLVDDWTQQRAIFESVRDSFMQHVANRYQSSNMLVKRLEHRLPTDVELYQQRVRLTDRNLYLELPDVVLAEASARPVIDIPFRFGRELSPSPLAQPGMGNAEEVRP